MALTKATLIDLNANELILDLDADTSITADSDDTIDFKIGGSDEIKMTSTALTPATADGSALGTAALEWADLFLADASVINFGADQDVTLTHVHNTGLLLNSTMALQFNDASQYINAPSNAILDINATDEIELNATLVDVNANLDVSGTIVAAGALTAATSITVGSAALTEAELELLDGLTAGTAIASKVVTTDANIDSTGMRNLTISGELDAATLDISGNADIDGTLETDALSIASTTVTTTAAEINLIDGGTSRGTDAVASGDGLLVNDAGTMKMTNVDTVSTYFSSHNVGGGNIVTTGALNSGSITSGFGAIDNGTSNIRSATITAETAFVPDASGGADLGTTSLEFNDLFLNDSGSIQFGDDQDTTLTHTDGTGLTLNSTNKLCFNDASQFVQGSSNAILSLGATDEIDLTATAIDINGTCDVSGTLTNASAAVKVAGKESIWIPATAMRPTSSNGCAKIADVETTAGRPDLNVLDFDGSSDEHAQFSVAFPKSWNLGTVTFQAFWTSTATDTDGVSWALQGVAMNDNETIDVAYGTAIVVDDACQSAAEELYVTAESGAVTIAGTPADNDLTYFRIFRDVSDANDTAAEDARLLGIKLFYTTDSANDA